MNEYQLLLVDDDINSVDCVKSGIAWELYGIQEPQVAYNIRQAKQALQHVQIDIMICDIEMPQGDGLELLAWINEQNLKVEVIFLTCHADFKYAQQALHMGSLEFLLKPVPFSELLEAVKKAQHIINKKREISHYEHTHQLWKSHQPRLIESFWIDLLDQHLSSDKDAIQEELKQRAIPYTIDVKFLPVLVSVQRWHKSLTNRDYKIMEYALRNALEEQFNDLIGIDFQIVQQRSGSILIFLMETEGYHFDINLIKEICHTYIHSCNQYFYCDLSCYMGLPTQISDVKEMVNSLYHREADNVNSDNRVFVRNDKDWQRRMIQLPNINSWFELLKLGSRHELIQTINCFLDSWMEVERLDSALLRELYQDFLQMVHYTLKVKGHQAHQILSSSVSIEPMMTATRSVTELREWMNMIIELVLDHMESLENSQTVVEKVMHYIDIHLHQDISREEIAQHVYLNADYLNRIFKKETALSLSEYVLKQRIRKAKELLLKTEMPVGSVATSVGFSNLPYFSKMFKRETQMSPQDFRHSRQVVNQ
ncbi:response regulator [Paenibacillus sp. N3.4]|uniref:response regulator transcription factor n=1 Tax=Paenibacillus sp. N3.4 TaxID=2603222 RepID=UPI0016501C9B|nr:response regulator [Paenibacillus sp. N3.4]